jgi:hypothetical protein
MLSVYSSPCCTKKNTVLTLTRNLTHSALYMAFVVFVLVPSKEIAELLLCPE